VRTPVLVLALLLAPLPLVQAADPRAPAADDTCLMLNNRILGPRAEGRPLPLLRGDAGRGFVPACSATWSVISPKNEPLPVDGCFKGSLLRILNDSACGAGTGKLWIGARWVVTTADLAQSKERVAVCQQLETGAWAGTRAFSFECKPRSRELNSDAKPGDKPPPPAATPPAAPPPQNPR
jgi:hypothetical protein